MIVSSVAHTHTHTYVRDKKTSAGLCAKNAGGLMREGGGGGGIFCGTLQYIQLCKLMTTNSGGSLTQLVLTQLSDKYTNK